MGQGSGLNNKTGLLVLLYKMIQKHVFSELSLFYLMGTGLGWEQQIALRGYWGKNTRDLFHKMIVSQD